MPTKLARLFGRGRPYRGDHSAFGLRLVTWLLEAERPHRVFEIGCRLAHRSGICDGAVVLSRRQTATGLELQHMAGGLRGHSWRDLETALVGRQSPLLGLGQDPLWIRLTDDPFQSGAGFLRRFDQRWLQALPFVAEFDGAEHDCVALLSGRDSAVGPRHAVIRDAKLIWLAVRHRLDQTPTAGASGPWADPATWDGAPAALALVGPEGVIAANAMARDLLAANVGHNGKAAETWLTAAVQRLIMTGVGRETLAASQSRDRQITVTMGDEIAAGGPHLVGLEAAVTAPGNVSDDEATLRMLGHELRTPLAAMKTSLDLVTRGDTGPLNEDQSRFLDATRRNLDRLNRLLGDLLDAKSIGAGRHAIEIESIDLGGRIRDDLTLFDVAAREKGLRLDTTGVPESLRACVDGDKVQQMLHNVVSNAIKYTPSGGLVRVWIQDRTKRVPGLGSRLARHFDLVLDAFTLVVEDSGMGMSKEYLRQIFQPFSREGRAEARHLPGSGLGLHITRGLVEAHGGEIRLDSHPGQGTTVWVTLPREPESGRILNCGRRLATALASARAAERPAVAVSLDLRHLVNTAQPWELDAGAKKTVSFLNELAGDQGKLAGDLCWTLASGLWVGAALAPERLAAAWEVATSAPECPSVLVGTTWQELDDLVDADSMTATATTRTSAG